MEGFIILVLIVVAICIISATINHFMSLAEDQRRGFWKEKENFDKNCEEQKRQIQKLLNELKDKQSILEDTYTQLTHLLCNGLEYAPELASMISDFLQLQYQTYATFLKNKKHPAFKKAEDIELLAQEAKREVENQRIFKYHFYNLINNHPEFEKTINDYIYQNHIDRFDFYSSFDLDIKNNPILSIYKMIDKLHTLEVEVKDELILGLKNQVQYLSKKTQNSPYSNQTNDFTQLIQNINDCYVAIENDFKKLEELKKQLINAQNTFKDENTQNLEQRSLRLDKSINFYSNIRKDNPYITQEQQQYYLSQFNTLRLNKAFTEYLNAPIEIQVSAKMPSYSTDEVYDTTLDSCTCVDFQRTGKPCKHMIALAIYTNAVYNMKDDSKSIAKALEKAVESKEEAEKAAKELTKEQHKLEKEQAEISKLLDAVKSKEQTYPWIAEIISNYRTAKHDVRIRDNVTKQQMTAILKKKEKQIALLENQIAVYEYNYPILQEFKDVSPEKLSISLSAAGDTGFVYQWLSEDEYKALTNQEKQQLWIDNYFAGKSKNAWEAGIKYERYIGYLCEKNGYTVKYTGALLKRMDMGRDLIVSKGKNVFIIQCKRYAESKQIHENSIFQLFGSVTHYQNENPNKNVKGVFVTTTSLSDIASECANKLEIDVFCNVPFVKYPSVKCNIAKDGEKIYHLPFDQQYDTTTIEFRKGEFYTDTIAEACEKGFRHAFKHSAF